MYQSNRVRIAATGSYVPKRIVANAELTEQAPTEHDWIVNNLGIKERRIAETNELTSDLATEAAKQAILASAFDKNDIDLVIVATATPDRKAPSTACIVKNKLGITNHCPAFDLSAVCSGFLYALSMASALIQSNTHKRALIIGADTFSRIT